MRAARRLRPVERAMRALPSASLAAALLLGMLPSCGGRSEENDGSGGGSGASTGSGATTGSGASTGSGATTGSGGSSGGAGTGGATSVCELPAETGPCNAGFPRYFHNSMTGLCEPFTYGGCGGNENNYETFADCAAACGSVELDTCEANTDCVLEAAGCCGVCGAGTADDYVAINGERVVDYYRTTGCNGVACGPCPEPLPYGEVPPVVATCESGRCKVVDLLEAGVFSCEVDSDCHLRHGLGCCAGCGSDQSKFIAIADENKLSDLVCPGGPLPCPYCEFSPPPCMSAKCNTGTCSVTSTCE